MKTTFSLPDETTIRYTRVFDAPVERVWAAYTDPALVRSWLLGPHPETTFEVCDMDMRTGGSYRWVWQNPDGPLEMYGDVLEADAPHRLVTTEQVGGTDWPPTHNEVSFEAVTTDEAQGAATRMTGVITYASKEARDGAYASGMGEGMDISFDRLEQAL